MQKLARIVMITGALAFVGSMPTIAQVSFAQEAALPAAVQAGLAGITPAQQARLLRNINSLPAAARASFLTMTPAQIIAVAALSPAAFSQVANLPATQRVEVASAVANVNAAARSNPAGLATALEVMNTALVNTGNPALRTTVAVGVSASISEAAAASPAGSPLRAAAVSVAQAAAATTTNTQVIETLTTAAAAVADDATELDEDIGAINEEASQA